MYRPKSIIKGTALLTGAALLVKLLGAIYRIPLARLIGPEGIGLYQMAYPIYLIFLSLSTAGVPIAISRMISEAVTRENYGAIRRVFQASLLLLFILGTAGSITMAFSAHWLAHNIVVDPRAIYAMWALAPAIFFMSLMAVFRGYFQGWQEMAPSAISQVIEQVVRVAVALALAFSLLGMGIEHAAAGAAFGATAGGAAGLTFLVGRYWRERPKGLAGAGRIRIRELLPVIKRLVLFALPISLSVILMPLLQTLDTLIVPARLQSIGYTVKEATAMLGILGNSWAVLYLPLVVTAAVASNMVPAIAAMKTAGRHGLLERKITEGLRLTLLYLIPAAVMFGCFGKTIYRIIYAQAGVELLIWLAPAVVFLGLEQVSAGILQGLGKPQQPLVNFFTGAVVKVLITLVATGLPGLNLAGSALGTVCGSGITAGLNLWAIKRLVGTQLSFKIAIFTGGGLMVGLCWYGKRLLQFHYAVEMVLVGLVACLGYGVILWIMGGIQRADLEEVYGFFHKRRLKHGRSNQRCERTDGTVGGYHGETTRSGRLPLGPGANP